MEVWYRLVVCYENGVAILIRKSPFLMPRHQQFIFFLNIHLLCVFFPSFILFLINTLIINAFVFLIHQSHALMCELFYMNRRFYVI